MFVEAQRVQDEDGTGEIPLDAVRPGMVVRVGPTVMLVESVDWAPLGPLPHLVLGGTDLMEATQDLRTVHVGIMNMRSEQDREQMMTEATKLITEQWKAADCTYSGDSEAGANGVTARTYRTNKTILTRYTDGATHERVWHDVLVGNDILASRRRDAESLAEVLLHTALSLIHRMVRGYDWTADEVDAFEAACRDAGITEG